MTATATETAHRPATAHRVARSLDDLVGGTPLLRVDLPGLPDGSRLLAKLELFNPLASVKDRPALYMLRHAEETGLLPAGGGGTVIECSSGSTGISLAALCAARGHRCIIVMPDNATEERRLILRELGAEVISVDHRDGLPAAWAYAEELQRSMPGSFLPHQDENPANTRAHYETTGPEIWEATGGDIDVLVCGVGTGGTLMGTARYLRERLPDLRVVAVEPARSAVLSGGEPGPHGIPGIGAGYISALTDTALIDEVVPVADEAAAAAAHEITRATGLLVGISSGAAAWASRHVAAGLGRPATVVTVFPDTGERYLSTARAAL
ncbi:cysteine synthase family protein [Streptomyces bambusae]|uniref:PLP-dependent cysteine synthase family protein n=1 Tax=Streptomyces bambusae TaxID=1550616 RepID=UPI001CFE4975|nr:cysteine synthase family protein [Streptomyces bambusae]MCB5165697.1 cysteine synthase family protein [Streptomyces bambusae]